MLGPCHLTAEQQPATSDLFTHSIHCRAALCYPLQSHLAMALETAWTGTRFPYPTTHHRHLWKTRQRQCHRGYLLPTLNTARTRYNIWHTNAHVPLTRKTTFYCVTRYLFMSKRKNDKKKAHIAVRL